MKKITFMLSLLFIFFVTSCVSNGKIEQPPHDKHQWTQWSIEMQPSCFQEGMERRNCEICGEFEERSIPQIEHDYKENHRQDPSCNQPGFIFYHCINCGDSYQEEIFSDNNNHNYYEYLRVEPTCNESGISNGYITYICRDCGHSYDEVLTKEACQFVLDSTYEATCTEKGYYLYVCTTNPEHRKMEYFGGVGKHNYYFDIFEDYHIGSICQSCYMTYENGYIEIEDEHGDKKYIMGQYHSWSDPEILQEPTCFEFGVNLKHCTICGYQTEEKVEPIHNYVNGKCSLCQSLEPSEGLQYKLKSDGTYALIGYTGQNADNLVLASHHKGVIVSEIADYAFKGKSINSLYIPKTISIYSEFAFSQISNLNNVYFGGNIVDWNNVEFELDDNNTTFFSTPANTGRNIYFINENNEYYKLEQLIIPSEIVHINNLKFAQMDQITSITLHENIEIIGKAAFYDCDNITSANVYANKIDQLAFASCDKLEEININDGVTTIESGAFYLNSSLTNINISNTVKTLGDSVFYDCDAITEITIPDSVTAIGSGVFYDCDELVNVSLSSNLVSYGGYNFAGCGKLEYTIIDDFYYIGSESNPKLVLVNTAIDSESYEIDPNVRFIESYAINSSETLKELIIPETVLGILTPIVNDCPNIVSLTTPYLNSYISSYFKDTISLEVLKLTKGNLANDPYALSELPDLLEVYIDSDVENIAIGILRDSYLVNKLTIPYLAGGSVNTVFNTKPEHLNYLNITNCTSLNYDIIQWSALNDVNLYIPNNLRSLSGALAYITDVKTTEYNGGHYLGSVENPYLMLLYVDSNESNFVLHNDTSIVSKYAYEMYSSDYYFVYENVIYIGTESEPYKIAYRLLNEYVESVVLHQDTKYISEAFTLSSDVKSFEFYNNIVEINAEFNHKEFNNSVIKYHGSISDWANISFNKLNSNPMYCFSDFYYINNDNLVMLTELIIPNDVTIIKDYSFVGFNVSNLELHDNIEKVGNYAFAYLTGISTLNYDSNVNISKGMFYNSNINELNITGDITSIGSYAFASTNIKNVNITVELDYIGVQAFGMERSIYTLKFTKVALIDINAFDCAFADIYFDGDINDWLDIEFVSEKSNPVRLDSNVYFKENGDYKLVDNTLSFDDEVTKIGDYQFQYFKNIYYVTLPSNLKYIGDAAFRSLNISEVELPLYLEHIGSYAFEGTYLTELIVPSTVEFIGIGIAKSSQISKLVLPFLGSDIYADDCDHIAYSFGEVNYNAEYDGRSYLYDVTILDGALGIGAFYECRGLAYITIPDVTYIPDYAFYKASAISKVNLSNVKEIGQYAFYECLNFREIYLSNRLTDIRSNAFADLYNGNEVYYDGTIEDWCKVNLVDIGSVPLKVDGTMYFKDSNGEYTIVEELIVPSNIVALSKYLFAHNTSLKEVYIPSTVTYIGEGIFEGDYNIEKLTIPFVGGNIDDNTTIDYFYGYTMGDGYSLYECTILDEDFIVDHTFDKCRNLRKLTFGTSVKQLGGSAFSELTLDEFYFDGKVEDWFNYYFMGEGSNPAYQGALVYMKNSNNEYELLLDLYIPTNIVSINSYAFMGFLSLKNVYVHSGYARFEGNDIFRGCDNIENVYYGKTFIDWLHIYINDAECNPVHVGANFYEYINGAYVLVSGDVTVTTNLEGNTHRISYQLEGMKNIVNLIISDKITGIESLGRLESLENVYLQNNLEYYLYDFERPFYYVPYNLYVYNENNEYVAVDSLTVDSYVPLNGYDFAGILTLEKVTFIGDCILWGNMFEDCINLKNITLSDGLIEVGQEVFKNCNSLVFNEYENGLYLGSETNPYLLLVKVKNMNETEFATHEDTKFIMHGIFKGYEALEKFTSSVSFTYGLWEYSDASPLKEVYYTATNNISSISYYYYTPIKKIVFLEAVESFNMYTNPLMDDGLEEVIFMKEGKLKNLYWLDSFKHTIKFNEYENGLYLGNSENPYMILCNYELKDASNVVIHPNTVNIMGGAFSYMVNLTEVTLPDSVRFIGDNAFNSCYNLTTINMPNVEYIGKYAFSGCSSLVNVTCPKLVEIDEYSFTDCSSLRIIKLPSTLEIIGRSVFNNTTLDYLIIPVGCTQIYNPNISYTITLPTNTKIYLESNELPVGNWSLLEYYLAGSWEYVDGIPTPKLN